jgi:hypothetical protein
VREIERVMESERREGERKDRILERLRGELRVRREDNMKY